MSGYSFASQDIINSDLSNDYWKTQVARQSAQIQSQNKKYYQGEQSATYTDTINSNLTNDYWKDQMALLLAQVQNQTEKACQEQQTKGCAVSARSAIGVPQNKSLQDEADRARSQSDQLKNLLGQLHYALFEPVPTNENTSLEKDNPSTIEGNLQHTTRALSSAILTLENILSKIGGR